MTMIGVSMTPSSHGSFRMRCIIGVVNGRTDSADALWWLWEVWRMIGSFGLIILLGMVSACTTLIPPPVPPFGSRAVSPEKAWARVLTRAVDKQGRVNFPLVAKDRSDLNIYLAYVARVSPRSHPELFPTRWERIAYHINSYNALAMYGVIANNIPKGFARFLDRARFFKFTEYRIGGENISLYDYENDIIRPIGEPRVHFALNCMAVGCPRLPRVPFRAKDLDQQLDKATREFFNRLEYVQVETEKQVVRLSEILRFYTEDFVNEKVAPSLIAYVNRYREEKIPENSAVEFIPYDWAVNTQ